MNSGLEQTLLNNRESGLTQPLTIKQLRHIDDQELFFVEQLQSCRTIYDSGVLCLDDLALTTSIIGIGGFSRVHKITDNKGRSYALKIYFEKNGETLEESKEREDVINAMMQNVAKNKRFVSEEPFLKPLLIADPAESNWYILEFAEGKNVECLMKYGELTAKDRQRAIHKYAEMLLQLHDQNMCFGDNNWGTVVINGKEVRFCDYDSITAQKSQNPLLARMQKPKYATKQWLEQVMHCRHVQDFTNYKESKENDLENFAYMILATFGVDVYDRKSLYRHPRQELSQKRVPLGLHNILLDLIDGLRLTKTDEFAEAIFRSI